MCGIIGLTAGDKNIIEESLKLLSHRGPDSQGVFGDGKVSLGHTRLAILDLSERANQPMIEENEAVISYNGEIYNFKELRNDLAVRGINFKTKSDTEVILKGYLEYGIDFFSKMRGMWALAIYDKKRGLIVLSRDCFGIKPLYYFLGKGRLVFASEMKAILSLVGSVLPNTEYFFQFFNLGYFIAPQTCYKEIKKLEPGGILVWNILKREVTELRVPLFDNKATSYLPSFEKAVDSFCNNLAESIRAHFVSDVPVGLLLSGGNDSSLLAALAKKEGFNPITYNLNIGNSSDSVYARQVSKRLGLEFVQEEMSDSVIQEQYHKVWEFLDEPTADISVIPTSLIFSVINSKTKVVLSGEGGDELFGGYKRALRLAGKTAIKEGNLPLSLLNAVSAGTGRLSLELFNPAVSRLKAVLLDRLQNDVIGSYLRGVKLIDYPISDSLIRKSLFGFYMKSEKESRGFSNNLFFDRFLYLPNDLMYKADISSMRHSVETRVPFLDKKLFNFIIKEINPKFCLSKEYNNKIIIKKVLERYLPKELIYRPKKGFAFSFKDHLFPEFKADVEKALKFHKKNAKLFGFRKTGLLNPANADILIRKYDRFAFALVSNWKIFKGKI